MQVSLFTTPLVTQISGCFSSFPEFIQGARVAIYGTSTVYGFQGVKYPHL